jgi:hypothetical protein
MATKNIARKDSLLDMTDSDKITHLYKNAIRQSKGAEMINQVSDTRRSSITLIGTLVVAAMIAMLTGCGVTQAAKRSALEDGPPSGFLSDYSQLQPGKDEVLTYLDAAAPWSEYSSVLIEPVTFWAGDMSKVPPEDQKALAEYATVALREHLGKPFALVEQSASGAIRVRAALTDAEAATPLARSISMAPIPAVRVLLTLWYSAAGSYPFVGAAQWEAELTDSLTGRRLAASLDRRIGGGSILNTAVWRWGDAEQVIDEWAETLAQRLVDLRSSAGNKTASES